MSKNKNFWRQFQKKTLREKYVKSGREINEQINK